MQKLQNFPFAKNSNFPSHSSSKFQVFSDWDRRRKADDNTIKHRKKWKQKFLCWSQESSISQSLLIWLIARFLRESQLRNMSNKEKPGNQPPVILPIGLNPEKAGNLTDFNSTWVLLLSAPFTTPKQSCYQCGVHKNRLIDLQPLEFVWLSKKPIRCDSRA